MKALRSLALLACAQLLLIGVYFAVENTRSVATAFAMERLDDPVPALLFKRAGAEVTAPREPHLVHFWATWCEPCKKELPVLLEAARAEGVPLLAVTDEPWPLVKRHFKQTVPEGIVRDPVGDAAAAWGVSGLPDTFVVRDGRVVGRMGGPRDWHTPEARDFLRNLRRTR